MARNQVVSLLIIFFCLGWVPHNLNAQELVFEKRPDSVPAHPNYGPNRRHYVHPFLVAGAILPTPGIQQFKTKLPHNTDVAAGIRYKLKISKPFSVVSEVGFERFSFRSASGSGIMPEDSKLHLSQTISSAGFFGGIFIRTRIGQNGDYLGNYIDVGITGQTNLINTLVTVDTVRLVYSGQLMSERTSKSSFSLFNPFTYSASIRLGFDKFSLVAAYRLSRLLNNKVVDDLPGLMVGLEFSPVSY